MHLGRASCSSVVPRALQQQTLVSSRAVLSKPVSLAATRPCATLSIDAPAAAASIDAELQRKCLEAAIQIKEMGFAVVEGVIPEYDCDAYVDSLWAWLESLGTGIVRSKPETYTQEAWPPVFRGILNTLEVGHQDFVWRIRTNPRLVRMFEMLLGTNELLTSFDAINMLGPHNVVPPPGWLHMDQAPERSALTCIQGIVNLVDIDPERTATLMVKPGSHKAHQEFFFKRSGLSQKELAAIPDHYQFTADQLPFWDQFESKKLAAGKGAVFLWDSRTVHSNAAPSNLEDWRHVVYSCYQPRSMASEHDLQLKRGAYENYELTTHLPAQNVRVYNAEFAAKYANEAKVSHLDLQFSTTRTRDAIEDATMRRLAGMEEYPPDEVWTARPLTDHSVEELRSMQREA